MLFEIDNGLPTRKDALAQLQEIIPKLGQLYASERNYDKGQGQHTNVSLLSPWVRHRLILEEELVDAALRSHGYETSEKFIQEVFWRTYWKGWLESHPSIWQDFQFLRNQAASDFATEILFKRAVSGETGINCFDYWVREIKETHYLHNHARMWFASIWIFTLGLPWALGADFFLKNLFDGDAASNTLSWRWVAGIQTRGKTYLARAENIAKFTQGRFNPIDELAITAPPVFGPEPPLPVCIKSYPAVKLGIPSLLLVTEDDLGLHNIPISLNNVIGIITLNSAHKRSSEGVSLDVINFVDSAIFDVTKTLHSLNAVPVETIQEDDPKSLLNAVKRMGAEQVITLRIPVGPARDSVDVLTEPLQQENIIFTEVTRDWDSLSWPLATKGFFKFKKSIPSILKKLNFI